MSIIVRTLASRSCGVPEAVDAQALADAVRDRGPWIERRVGVLEDDLHPAPDTVGGPRPTDV